MSRVRGSVSSSNQTSSFRSYDSIARNWTCSYTGQECSRSPDCCQSYSAIVYHTDCTDRPFAQEMNDFEVITLRRHFHLTCVRQRTRCSERQQRKTLCFRSGSFEGRCAYNQKLQSSVNTTIQFNNLICVVFTKCLRSVCI